VTLETFFLTLFGRRILIYHEILIPLNIMAENEDKQSLKKVEDKNIDNAND
jgi:hypothetical protein